MLGLDIYHALLRLAGVWSTGPYSGMEQDLLWILGTYVVLGWAATLLAGSVILMLTPGSTSGWPQVYAALPTFMEIQRSKPVKHPRLVWMLLAGLWPISIVPCFPIAWYTNYQAQQLWRKRRH